MDHETKLNQKLVEAFEVHRKHCQVCGDGNLCATGKALKKDAYPQNDSVGGIHSPLPWTVEIHDARGDYARIALVSRSSHFECGYYIVAVDDMAIRREQAIKDFKFIASTVNARADSVSPSVGEVESFHVTYRRVAQYWAVKDEPDDWYGGEVVRKSDYDKVYAALVREADKHKEVFIQMRDFRAECASLRAVVVELRKALTDINEYACYTEENYGEGACGQVLHWIGTTARAALTKVQAEKNSV